MKFHSSSQYLRVSSVFDGWNSGHTIENDRLEAKYTALWCWQVKDTDLYVFNIEVSENLLRFDDM